MNRKLDLLFKYIRNRDPYLLKRIIKALYENGLRFWFRFHKPAGIKVVDEDWDFLIVLDACRYDEFKEVNQINGSLRKVISLGSNTEEWLRYNFDKSNPDVIYITGNPQFRKAELEGVFDPDYFFLVENVWDYGWHEEFKTVLPTEMIKATKQLANKYPHKKFIIHFLQPHCPYISPTITDQELLGPGNTIIDNTQFGGLEINKVKTAARENLKFVLEEIKSQLLPRLHGKTVITSDHGEAFGEKSLYFHPEGIYIKELIEVPWLVVSNAT
ncbi:LTA synthase family protein [Patescibacteria group bacterium]|nr:LTA synthase family protein [Patescibacteria group bacterium]MBU1868427.1 LTA synthase family protein [Patescibacteria group bacterium]